MLRPLGTFRVDPSLPTFTEVEKSPKRYDSTFKIGNDLFVNFDNRDGGEVELGAVDPIIGSPYYIIKPVSLGGANWFTIEFGIDASNIHKLSQVIPYLDIASPGSVTLHSTLRLHYEDGRSEDISSTQIEIKRNRVRQTFPIALADLHSGVIRPLLRGTCIFFIEAREVELELYGFGITGVDKEAFSYSGTDIATLRNAAKQDTGSIQHKYAIIPGDNRVETQRHLHHVSIADGVFIDFQPAEGRAVDITSSPSGIEMAFENMQPAQWRNFEFRFDDIRNSGNMLAIIRIVGSTHFANNTGNRNGLLAIREYDEHYKWADTLLDIPLRLSSQPGEQVAVIDLYPILTDSRLRHRFGLMVFLPEDVVRVEVSEMESFVYDRRYPSLSANDSTSSISVPTALTEDFPVG